MEHGQPSAGDHDTGEVIKER